MKWYDELITFLIQSFTFIPKIKLENVLSTTLTNSDYYVCCIGIWIVLIVVIWFTLWMCFKVRSWF